ncbi:DEAD/DEAH box helicase [Micromonospora sp. HUAS YX12]|uniref:DEAD/DEAH box helicase n=1 Tax=Micromonospora sp. HUAS YX12 TaxID=3156396 RepID=A0AAU7R325_9ACTN
MRQIQTGTALRQLLTEWPGQNKRDLLTGLRSLGLDGLTTTDVNRVLYAGRGTFAHDGATPPRWRLAAGAEQGDGASIAPVPTRPRCYVGREPRAWQREALGEWHANGRRGVVEAVTGTGKTTVGVLAAAAAVDAGEKVLLLVPGRELLDQWHAALRRDLRIGRVGRLGDGHRDSLSDHSVLVATVQSAAKGWIIPGGAPGLLIADEVHRYGAKSFARALNQGFEARLGLTATYERTDNGLIDHLQPYFGEVVAGCTYERGLADDILAPFRVAFLGADFAGNERELYDQYDEQVRTLRRRLVLDHDCPAEPFGEFITHVNELSRGGHGSPRATMDASRYLNAFSKRRQLLAGCRRKREALASLAPILAEADAGLVFSETTASAEQAAGILRGRGVSASEFTSELHRTARKHRLTEFKHGRIKVLTAPRVLDEGIDLPQAEVGVVVAGTQSKRQMIQRMGRVIRPKHDRRPATFVVLYIRGTSEDPKNGAHEGFIDQLVDVVADYKTFRPGAPEAKLLWWYREGRLR